MDTRTITVELDAYEKIEKARLPRETFSEAIRRASWLGTAMTGRELLAHLDTRGPWFTEDELDSIERAEAGDRPPGYPFLILDTNLLVRAGENRMKKE